MAKSLTFNERGWAELTLTITTKSGRTVELPLTAEQLAILRDETPVPMKLVQHIPGFVEGGKPWRVDDWDGNPDSVPCLATWSQGYEGWVGWRISDNALLAVYENGNKWWVVAHFSGKPDIPKWEGPPKDWKQN